MQAMPSSRLREGSPSAGWQAQVLLECVSRPMLLVSLATSPGTFNGQGDPMDQLFLDYRHGDRRPTLFVHSVTFMPLKEIHLVSL